MEERKVYLKVRGMEVALEAQFAEAETVTTTIREKLAGVGVSE